MLNEKCVCAHTRAHVHTHIRILLFSPCVLGSGSTPSSSDGGSAQSLSSKKSVKDKNKTKEPRYATKTKTYHNSKHHRQQDHSNKKNDGDEWHAQTAKAYEHITTLLNNLNIEKAHLNSVDYLDEKLDEEGGRLITL